MIDLDRDFRVNLYRGQQNDGTNTGTIKNAENEEQQILTILKTNSKSTQKDIQEQMKISIRSGKRIMADLQKKGMITRKGNNRSGEWIIK